MSNAATNITPTTGRLPVQVKQMPAFMMEKFQELQELKDHHKTVKRRLIQYQITTITLRAILILTLGFMSINYLV